MIPLRYNLRSLTVRKTTTIATALGIALVVFVLSSALMLSAGVKKTCTVGGSRDVAIVLAKGSNAELESNISLEKLNSILGAPGIKRDEKGQPIGVGEVVVVNALEKVGASGVTNVTIRGVHVQDAMKLRPEVQLIEGVMPQPGTEEVIIGQRIRGRFKGVDLGQSFDLRKNRPVKIVGVFTSNGSSYESEVWADVDVLRAAYGRDSSVSSVRVKLESPASFEVFKSTMENDKAFGYKALTDVDYFDKVSNGTSIFLGAMGGLISVFFSIGAMIGAMITMYAAVANRQREIGTLRALGFSRTSILGSFLLESIILAALGGLVGAIASLGMGFVRFSMMNFTSWSEIVFSFDPTAKIIGTSLLFAAGMGLFGGFFPAVRAARVSPIAAMRA
jgi:putative ABC transport system permease protein